MFTPVEDPENGKGQMLRVFTPKELLSAIEALTTRRRLANKRRKVYQLKTQNRMMTMAVAITSIGYDEEEAFGCPHFLISPMLTLLLLEIRISLYGLPVFTTYHAKFGRSRSSDMGAGSLPPWVAA